MVIGLLGINSLVYLDADFQNQEDHQINYQSLKWLNTELRNVLMMKKNQKKPLKLKNDIETKQNNY